MKNKYLLIGAILLSHLSWGQDFNLISDSGNEVTIEHRFKNKQIGTVQINNEAFLNYTSAYKVVSLEEGKPALPFFTESVVVPNQGDISINITHGGYIEYTNVDVAPSKGNLKRNVDPSTVGYTFGEVYNEDKFYPEQIAEIGDPHVLRNTRGVTIQVNPIQYNPVTHTIRVYKDVVVQVVNDKNATGINEIYSSSTKKDVFAPVYANHYLNAKNLKYTTVEEEGEMLIITDPSFIEEMVPFVDWKTQKGIKTKIVTTTETGTLDTDIKLYIENYYATNPNLIYVLLVGDHNHVASHTYGMSGGEQLWSDSYYGQLAGGASDYYPELFVGRFSAGTEQHIMTQVERTLEYEKTPAAGNWMEQAIGLASNEGSGIGDDGEPDWQHARNIRTQLMNFGYSTVHEFYDGSHGGEDAAGDPSSTIILPAVNAGVGLFNYTGHGAQNVCVTGNFSSSHINQATNNGYYPYVISVACNNGTFTSGTCISEVWMRATNNGAPTGSIAAAGSSILMAWAAPMQTQDEMAELISESYANNRKSTIGGLFYNSQMSMLENYNSNASSREVMQTWVLFGDPSAQFRSKATLDLAATHVSSVPQLTSSVNVNCNVEGAKIGIVQDGQLIGTGFVSSGVATITFPTLISNSPLLVTATKQNYKPYQGSIVVGNGPVWGLEEAALHNVVVAPNPANEVLNIQWEGEGNVEIELVNVMGQVVKTISNDEINGNSTTINISNLTSGFYYVNTTINGAVNSMKIIKN